MAQVKAPNAAYNGVGPGGAVFRDGVAEVEDGAALNYYRSAGYGVDGEVENPVEAPEPADPRKVTEVVSGTRLRDAAVDPEPGDFLAPTNAGKDNPHGSTVVSPEIHASGPAGIRPGEVYVEDVDKQEKRELEFAVARLVENQTAADANAAEVSDPDDHGPLDLSDPGSVEAGVREAQALAAEADSTSEPSPKRTRKTTAAKRS